MKRAAATTAFVRSWLPSVWKRALQRLLQFLLRLSLFPRRLLMLERHGGAAGDTPTKRRWLRAIDSAAAAHAADDSEVGVDGEESGEFFFTDDATHTSASARLGLRNTGNTCFVNAVVQCLLAIPGFADRLEEEVERVVEEEAANEGRVDGRGWRKHKSQVELALTLLDLLKGLVPEEVEIGAEPPTADTNESVASAALQCGSSNGPEFLQHSEPKEQTQAIGKKRKRPMRTLPGDYSVKATTKRLRGFLQAASKCSDLVSGDPRCQDQQDAEELLLILLDSLHESLKPPPRAIHDDNETRDSDASAVRTADLLELNRLVELENECLKILKKCVVTDPGTYNTTVAFLSEVRWHRYLNENSSFITEMFTGQIVRGSQCCSCANLTCLHQEFRVLSLSVDASSASQTLEHCLEVHRRLEDLVADNQVFCDGHCKGKTSRRTQVLLQRAPPTLVIQLQRFKQTSWQTSAEKIATGVEFPISGPLDLTSNMFLRDTTRPLRYKLQAVCSHIGSSLNSGHYIAYTRDNTPRAATSSSHVGNEPSHWLKFDDACVTTLDEDALQAETNTTAYMLFYTQTDEATSDGLEAEVEVEVEEQQQPKGSRTDLEKPVEDDDNI